jgi:hypothetical protein
VEPTGRPAPGALATFRHRLFLIFIQAGVGHMSFIISRASEWKLHDPRNISEVAWF